MKSRFSFLGIIAVVIVSIVTCFIGCNNNINDVVRYYGHVVYINTTNPFPDLLIKVTNGQDTHCQTQTDAGGEFSLNVRVNEIDGNYYLLAGDSTCVPKKVVLGGFGQAEVDLGTIEVEGPSIPTVSTDTLISLTAETASLNCTVVTDGRLTVTARGVCYGTNQQPTIDGLRTTDGSGVGQYTSNIKGLEHNTVYYARAYATNRMGTAYGNQIKFITELGVPVVMTDSVYRITAHSARCKGHVESDGGYAVTKKGTCWSKQADPTVDDECTNDGSGKGEFTSSLNNLQENTIYYVRTYATNSTATVYGEQIIISTLDGLAIVTTDSITNVIATGFMAHGTVVGDCDIPVTERGFCYATTQYPTIENDHITSGKGLGNYKSNISNLKYGTTYYVRSYATNATETTYGEQKVVTTLDGLPKVTTAKVTNVNSVRATCGGEVTDDGSLTVSARGVCYGKEQQPTIEGLHTTNGKGLGSFTSNLTDLQDKTTYYVRAYATTDAGTAYGEERSFRTEDGIPTVELISVGEPTANSVTCNGKVTSDRGVTVTERGFCYSTSQYPTVASSNKVKNKINNSTGTLSGVDNITFNQNKKNNTVASSSGHVAIGDGVGDFTGSITNLEHNTTYYIRAYAINSIGIGYSDNQEVFTTKNGLATVVTTQPTAYATTISAGGEITDNGGYAVTERGVCYSATNSEPEITDNKVVSGKGNGSFNISITDLAAGTIYYVRAYATNENGTSYGEAISITTKNGVSIVNASAITNITAMTATGGVTVTDADGATLQKCGICWSVNPGPTITDSISLASGKQLNTAYPCNMTGLQPNTTYYVRAFAITDVAMSFSEQVSFKTVLGLPIVKTNSGTSTANSITATGEVIDNGGYNVTERGFCYSKTNSEPTISDAFISAGSGSGTFSASIINLDAATTYYIRAYAKNSIGIAYGEIQAITTSDGSAIVTLSSIANIMATTATAGVTVTDAGGSTLQQCGICWSVNPNPTINDNLTEASGKQLNTTYTCYLSGLTPNTAYYVRAYATTDITTTYSDSRYFTTDDGLPSLSTIFIGENVTETTAITGGVIANDGGFHVVARGVCWNTVPNPTINNNKTEDGDGIGTYSSQISDIDLTGSVTYYVRAYATNQNGTAYGNEVVVNNQNLVYKKLPRVAVDGYIYVLYDDIGDMFYGEAVDVVESMTFAGYDDWILEPNDERMRYIMENCLEGWKDMWGYPVIVYTKENPAPTSQFACASYYWTSDPTCIDDYQSTVYCSPGEYYDWETHTTIYITAATSYCSHVPSNRNRVRPMRRYMDYGGGQGGDTETSYYIKHPWGTGLDEDWTWAKMHQEGSEYTYTGPWGGKGANINTTASDDGAIWFPTNKIVNSENWDISDVVTFVYDPATSTLTTR